MPFKIEQGDRRFVVNRTRDKFSPTGVKNGEITQEEFVEFGRKLDRIKNDNEVAYELFAMVMRLDLSGFDKTRLPVTEAKTEQQNETSCKVTAWIERVAKLEFYDPANQLEEYFEFENDKIVSLKTCRLSVALPTLQDLVRSRVSRHVARTSQREFIRQGAHQDS